jgi:diguanylate cyclase (GGDEF)-like protein
MRAAVRQTLPAEEVEAEVARRVARHVAADGVSFDRLYPNGRWMRVSKQRLSTGAVVGFAMDVTELVEQRRSLELSEARYRALAETAPVGICRIDRQGRPLYANPWLERLLAPLGGVAAWPLGALELRAPGFAGPVALLPAGIEATTRLVPPAGDALHLLLVASAWIEEAPGRHSRVVTLADITARESARAAVEHLARHDPLTGLGNRGRFAAALAEVEATGRSADLLLVDLDRFKQINDRFGHALGDGVLRAVAGRMREAVRGGDLVCRVGGDEFAVLLVDTDRVAADAVARRLGELLAGPWVVDGHELEVGASIGTARLPDDAADARTLQRHADLALYRVKRGGRGAVGRFDRALAHEAAVARLIEEALGPPLPSGELRLLYQPQVGLADGALVGVEALVRWASPRLGRDLSPGEFLPIAERSSVIHEVDRWVFGQVLRQVRAWRGAGVCPPLVALNVSPASLLAAGLPDLLLGLAQAEGVPPCLIEIEVPERVAVADLDRLAATLHRLRAIGFKVALDDLGGGVSSFAHLARLPIDRLKLDRSLIQRLVGSAQDRAVVRAAAAFATELRLGLVGEGVETAAQRRCLLAAGCEVGQGFLLGRPQTPGGIARLLAAGRGGELAHAG